MSRVTYTTFNLSIKNSGIIQIHADFCDFCNTKSSELMLGLGTDGMFRNTNVGQVCVQNAVRAQR